MYRYMYLSSADTSGMPHKDSRLALYAPHKRQSAPWQVEVVSDLSRGVLGQVACGVQHTDGARTAPASLPTPCGP
jgi:hypothetical protein